jgi:hypothetical protein
MLLRHEYFSCGNLTQALVLASRDYMSFMQRDYMRPMQVIIVGLVAGILVQTFAIWLLA